MASSLASVGRKLFSMHGTHLCGGWCLASLDGQRRSCTHTHNAHKRHFYIKEITLTQCNGCYFITYNFITYGFSVINWNMQKQICVFVFVWRGLLNASVQRGYLQGMLMWSSLTLDLWSCEKVEQPAAIFATKLEFLLSCHRRSWLKAVFHKVFTE